MAVYSTFFVAQPAELPAAFPNWKAPLPKPVERERFNPFTGERVIVIASDPDWDDVDLDSQEIAEYQVVSIEGDYADYLEQRLPRFVRSQPHWCAKGLTNIEIEALAAVALQADEIFLESAMYAHPSRRAALMQFPDSLSAVLKDLSTSAGIENLATAWAARMSTPEHTHSMDGERLYDDWRVEDAQFILEPLVRLAKDCSSNQSIYMLIEA